MNEQYIVLRGEPKKRAESSRSTVFGRLALGKDDSKAEADEENERTVEVHRIKSRHELADLVNDEGTLASALEMPVSLIAPVAFSAQDMISQAGADGMSWGVRAVGADVSRYSGRGVTVAVLDTGVNPAHPAFRKTNMEREDFIGSGSLDDENGHGTHCAATIFGRDVGGIRIGVAPGVTRALIAKVLSKEGQGTSSALAKAIQWAIDGRAHVISMSIGFDFPGMIERLQRVDGLPPALAASKALRAFRDNLRLFDTLMNYAEAHAPFANASIVVAASGNESRRDVDEKYQIEASLPAASRGVVSVGALMKVGSYLSAAPFSNINPVVSAPGVGIVSANLTGSLSEKSGTSMACPHAAGVAALWCEHLQSQKQNQSRLAAASLVAHASREGFAPDCGLADYGAGMVRAP